MFEHFKRFDSTEGNVWKYIFEGNNVIAEAVIYRYATFEERTVICCSVQSGCPVGCKFCGTGKRFIRNLTWEEIVDQVQEIFLDMEIDTAACKKLQIMFMSMGEPMLNWLSVRTAIEYLHGMYPNAQLLISTVGVDEPWVQEEIIELAIEVPAVGLQFSIHEAFECARDALIPFPNKMDLHGLRDFGIRWSMANKRQVFLNYCITKTNTNHVDLQRLMDLFSPMFFTFTFSVVCSADETAKDAGFREYDRIREVMDQFFAKGYNVRMFDPAGQDDIGGGCGQLWYVQKWMAERC